MPKGAFLPLILPPEEPSPYPEVLSHRGRGAGGVSSPRQAVSHIRTFSSDTRRAMRAFLCASVVGVVCAQGPQFNSLTTENGNIAFGLKPGASFTVQCPEDFSQAVRCHLRLLL